MALDDLFLCLFFFFFFFFLLLLLLLLLRRLLFKTFNQKERGDGTWRQFILYDENISYYSASINLYRILNLFERTRHYVYIYIYIYIKKKDRKSVSCP